jgi:hypothetical protein
MPGPDERITSEQSLPAFAPSGEPAAPLPEEWRAVGLGLKMLRAGLISLFVSLLVLGVTVFGPLAIRVSSRFETTALPLVLMVGWFLGLLTAGLVILAGEAVLWAAPKRSRVGSWALVAFLLGLCGRILAILASFGAPFTSFVPTLSEHVGFSVTPAWSVWLSWLLAVAAALASLAEIFLLGLGLSELAYSLGRIELGRRAVLFARFFLGFVLLLAGLSLLLALIPKFMPVEGGVVQDLWTLLVGLVACAILCILILLSQLIGIVTETLAAVSGEGSK